MKCIPLWAFLFFLTCDAAAQQGKVKSTPIKPAALPAEIAVKAKAGEALRFSDREGEHLVVLSESGIYVSPEDESNRHAELFAQHFLLMNGQFAQSWMLHDFIKDCPVDLEARFIPGTFQVSDLNQDGVAEVWMMYTTVCHGDVSPSNMKLIMYQGAQKYAMRGRNCVQLSEKDRVGGEYQFDQAFKDGPAVFRAFAQKRWKQHLMPRWE